MNQLESILIAHKEIAFLLSILCNILISIIGVIPSVFLTALNVKLFGFIGGAAVSLIGEAAGAVAAFFLYRHGFRKWVNQHAARYPKAERLLHVEGKEAFLLVLSLRLLPFVPSSLVTLFAALGKMDWLSFLIASTTGKVPALLIETYSVSEVLNWSGTGKIMLGAFSVIMLLYIWKQKRK